MLFRGTYTTAFYRRLRDLLHLEARLGTTEDGRWAELERDEPCNRSGDATLSVAG